MPAPHVDLGSAEVVDVHCHGWRNPELLERDPDRFADRVTMMGMCLRSSGLADAEGDPHLAFLTDSTPLALAMLARLGEHLDCEPTREAVGAARRTELERDPTGYLGRLWRDAGVVELLVDEGFPQPTVPTAELERAAGLSVRRVARIEPWIVELRESAASYDELEDAFPARSVEATGNGAGALKSVTAFRTRSADPR